MAKLLQTATDHSYYTKRFAGGYYTQQIHPYGVAYLKHQGTRIGQEIASTDLIILERNGWLYTKGTGPKMTLVESDWEWERITPMSIRDIGRHMKEMERERKRRDLEEKRRVGEEQKRKRAEEKRRITEARQLQQKEKERRREEEKAKRAAIADHKRRSEEGVIGRRLEGLRPHPAGTQRSDLFELKSGGTNSLSVQTPTDTSPEPAFGSETPVGSGTASDRSNQEDSGWLGCLALLLIFTVIAIPVAFFTHRNVLGWWLVGAFVLTIGLFGFATRGQAKTSAKAAAPVDSREVESQSSKP